MSWLSILADIGSLIGLGLTIYVAWAISRLRQRYVKQAAMIECRERLIACRKTLSAAITNKNEASATKAVSQIRAILEDVNRHSQDFSVRVEFLPRKIIVAFSDDRMDIWRRAMIVRDHVEYCLERIHGELRQVEWGKDDV